MFVRGNKTYLKLFKDKKTLGYSFIIFPSTMLPVSGDRTLLMSVLQDTLPVRVLVMRSLGQLQPSPGHCSSATAPLSQVVGQICGVGVPQCVVLEQQ